MKHLTIDEIKKFVSINKMDDESMSLASKVNLHILKCDKCLKVVEAYQELYDGLKQGSSCGKKIDDLLEAKSEAEKSQHMKFYL
ncbi:MAG: hypothetical protein IJ275_07270 [Ruminococcus sp.]|nr:hypothetical protein [Ruminococcus sp.]